MRKKTGLLLALLSLLMVMSCTDVPFNHPLDAKGSDFIGKNNPDLLRDDDGNGIPYFLEDDDGDGIPNYKDPDNDTIKPVITLTGELTVYIKVKDPEKKVELYSNIKSGYCKAIDDVDGDITSEIKITHNISVFIPGTYQMTYTVSDRAFNAADPVIRTFVVVPESVVDTSGPVISLYGPPEVTIYQGTEYKERGAEAYDIGDGQPCAVTTSGEVNTAVIGRYEITYTAVDSKGNVSSIKRTVVVQAVHEEDNIPPVITLNPPDSVFLELGQAFVDPGATAIDNKDGNITNKIQVTNPVKVDSAAVYWVIYTVTDEAGNFTSKRRYVKVGGGGDFTPPDLTLIGEDSMAIAVGAVFVDPGYTAVDDVDGIITNQVTKDPPTINTSVEGLHIITYTVSDAAGNVTQRTRKVMVSSTITLDQVPPVIKLLGDNPDTVTVGKSWTDPGCTATDNMDGTITYNVKKEGEVNTQVEGEYTITYSVSDKAGNKTVVTRTVIVTAVVSLFQKYGVPSPDPLPAVGNAQYKNHTIEGDADPDMLYTVTSFTFNWDPGQNKIYSFAFNYGVSPYYKNFEPTHNFNSPQPKFTLKGSEVDGLDGDYYIVMQGENCIWVRTDGSFAIIWEP